MRRTLALLMLLCCLLGISITAFATEAEDVEQLAEEEMIETAEEEPAAEPLPEEEPQAEVTAIDGETAIRTMEITVSIDGAGRATVTQSLEMNVVGTVEELRFSFPEGAKNARVMGWRTKAEKEHGLRYLTVSERDGFPRTQTFELCYTIDGIVSEAEDSQVLALPLLSLQDYRIGKLTFAVAMPELFSGTPRFSSGYYNTLVEDVMTVRTEEIWVVGAMKEIMRDNDSLVMTLTVPDGFFSGHHGESRMPSVLTTITLVLLAGVMIYWFRTLKNPPLKVRVRTLPPDGVNPGDLPFLICDGDTDFNMLVSHWAVLGYLSIYVNKAGHVILRRRMDMGNERRKLERRLFDLLFGESDVCDGASVRYKRVGEKAMQVVRRYWGKRLYEKHSGSPALAKMICWLACALAALVAMNAVAPSNGHGFFLFLALIAGAAMGIMIAKIPGCYYMGDWIQVSIGIGCALLLLVIGIVGEAALVVIAAIAVTAFIGWQTCHGGLRRPYGDEVIGQTMGFRRFLLHASEHHVLQMMVRDPQYFYKLLPYAEAMGQGRKFVSLFHDCRLEPCQWYDSARGIPSSAVAFYEHYRDTLDMLNLSIKK